LAGRTKNYLFANPRLGRKQLTTHQRNPVSIKCTESHFRNKLGAGKEQEVEVEEVLELVEQHLGDEDSREETLRLI
jgi:hypothetical protein